MDDSTYCDIAKEHTTTYFYITIAYIVTTMLIPIIIIFACNSLIIFYILKSRDERARLSNANIIRNNSVVAVTAAMVRAELNNIPMSTIYSSKAATSASSTTEGRGGPVPTPPLPQPLQTATAKTRVLIKSRCKTSRRHRADAAEVVANGAVAANQTTSLISPGEAAPAVVDTDSLRGGSFRTRPFSTAAANGGRLTGIVRMPSQYRSGTASGKDGSLKITRMLLFMSFSYAILNLPYLIAWSFFFYRLAVQRSADKVVRYYLFAAIQFSEIFYVINYAIHFFIYCASGKRFRFLLRNALSFK
jgi:hypothetical protein